MTEQIRINRIEQGATLAGKPVVHLFAPGAQYAQFPALYLFDPGLLIGIGIDPNSLGEDPIHCNLWTHYEVSTKKNSKGNYYKDVVSLERIDQPATTTSTDTTAMLQELRAIKALLLELVTSDQPPPAAAPDLAAQAGEDRDHRIHALNRAGRTAAKSCGSTADPQVTKPPDLTEAQARTEFYTLAGDAIGENRVDPNKVNDLTALANGDGWNTALAGLRDLLLASN